jgi:hypothetical protein
MKNAEIARLYKTSEKIENRVIKEAVDRLINGLGNNANFCLTLFEIENISSAVYVYNKAIANKK